MKRTGILSIDGATSRLDGTLLARAGAANPLVAATNFLQNRGLGDGDRITVTGTEGKLGDIPVIFITDATLADAEDETATPLGMKAAKGGRAQSSVATKKAGEKGRRANKSATKSAAKKSKTDR